MEGIEKPKMSVVTFAPATESHISELIDIEKSVPESNTYSSMLTEDEWKEEMLSNHIFLIKSQGAVVGSISYEIKDSEHLYISGIVVRPEYQGKGIAREALTGLLKQYASYKRIDLVTHPDNPALHLYQSLGFEVESRKENYFGDGEPRLVLVYTHA